MRVVMREPGSTSLESSPSARPDALIGLVRLAFGESPWRRSDRKNVDMMTDVAFSGGKVDPDG